MKDGVAESRNSWAKRLWSRNAAVLLGRNTAVSIGVFLLGLAMLWALVELGRMDKTLATGLTFMIATTLHYALGRTWIYRGTTRTIVPGYGYFMVNAGIGLVLTVILFDALIQATNIHYLVIRIAVSVIAGLVMFLLNAVLNFRRL